MFEQLRSIPVSRETHSTAYRECVGRQAAPVYGDGQQIRDWLYVTDHCSAIRRVLADGRLGETYNIGGWNEKPNLDIVHAVCGLLGELRPRADGKRYQEQITT